jgi:MFS family permease
MRPRYRPGTVDRMGRHRTERRPGLLRESRRFRYLWLSRTISSTGIGVSRVALVLLATPAGPTAVSALLLANTLPQLLGPLAGAVADRVDQRRLLAGCEAGQGVICAVIAIARPPLPALLPLVAVAGLLAALFSPAGKSSVPRLVPADRLPRANALLGTALNLQVMAGPALGGLLIGLAGPSAAFAVNAGSFAVSALLLGRLGPLPPQLAAAEPDTTAPGIAAPGIGAPGIGAPGIAAPGIVAPGIVAPGIVAPGIAAPGGSAQGATRPGAAAGAITAGGSGVATTLLGQTWAGLRYAAGSAVTRALVLATALLVSFAAIDNVALVFLVKRSLHGSASTYGLTVAAFGAGMLAASLLLSVLAARRPPQFWLVCGYATGAAGTVGTGLAATAGLACLAQAAAGAGNTADLVGNDTLIQQLVPRQFLGRVFGAVSTAAQAGNAVAYAAAGPLIALTGARIAFIIAGTGMLSGLLVLVPAMRAARRGPDPARLAAAAGPPRRGVRPARPSSGSSVIRPGGGPLTGPEDLAPARRP